MSDFSSLSPVVPPLGTLQAGQARNGNDQGTIEAEARRQANEFEATFIAALLQPVFEGLAKDSTFGGGFAEETWTGLLTQEYAKSVAGSANIGVADHVYNQLISLQEQSQEKTTPQTASSNQE